MIESLAISTSGREPVARSVASMVMVVAAITQSSSAPLTVAAHIAGFEVSIIVASVIDSGIVGVAVKQTFSSPVPKHSGRAGYPQAAIKASDRCADSPPHIDAKYHAVRWR